MSLYIGSYFYVGESVLSHVAEDHRNGKYDGTCAGVLFHAIMFAAKTKTPILYSPVQVIKKLENGDYGNLSQIIMPLKRAIVPDEFCPEERDLSKSLADCANNSPLPGFANKPLIHPLLYEQD